MAELAARLLYRWVRPRVDAAAARSALTARHPVVYVLPVRRLTDWWVLRTECLRAGLPSATQAVRPGDRALARSVLFLDTRGALQASAERQAMPERLSALVDWLQSDPDADVELVPVSILWGRAPQRQDSWLGALLAEGWSVRGAFARALAVLLHGRDTYVSFGAPLSLRALVAPRPGADGDDAREPFGPREVRRAARRLRAWFRTEREAAIGPDLSHRRTLLERVLAGGPVRAAVAAAGDDAPRAARRARRLAREIASDFSYPWVRAFEFALDALWNRLYDGVDVHGARRLEAIARERTLVYVPCHRSHVDYLLLSFIVHRHGRRIPHIAAGANLDLPLVGAMLRRGGAFFLRRSVRGDPLYATVFAEYLHVLLSDGVPIEYFIEGGRSRTGRSLAPRSGLLAMTVASFLRDPRREVAFVPVWIGYDRLFEGRSYLAELSGRPKRRETLGGLLRSLRGLREAYGRVQVSFGKPLELAGLLDAAAPGWRDASAAQPAADASQASGLAARPDWLGAVVDALGLALIRRINDAAVVTPLSLLAVALLASPRQAMDALQLGDRIERFARVVGVPAIDADAAIGAAVRLGYVERVAHPLGDLLRSTGDAVLLLGYLRNQILHRFALPALLAALVARQGRIGRGRLHAAASGLQPLVAAELFDGLEPAGLEAAVGGALARLTAQGLVRVDGDALAVPPPDAIEREHLEALAAAIEPTVVRLVVAMRVLQRAGSAGVELSAFRDSVVQGAGRFAALAIATPGEIADPGVLPGLLAALAEAGAAVPLGVAWGPGPALAARVSLAEQALAPSIRSALARAAGSAATAAAPSAQPDPL